MAAIQHIALGVYGFGCEDALTHLLNYVWPNIFETSPHVVQAFMGSIEGMRVGLGSTKVLQYGMQVCMRLTCKSLHRYAFLFHENSVFILKVPPQFS